MVHRLIRGLLRIETLTFLLLFFGSLYAVYYPLVVHVNQTPPATVYTYAQGYLPDYYQYLGWVKDGTKGSVLVSSRYTEVEYPKSLVHVLFPIIGIIGNFFQLPTFSSYTIVRFLSNIIFLFAFTILVRKIFSSQIERALSYIFLLGITGTWTLDTNGNLVEAINWVGNFNAVGKFFLPPHHLLALSFLIMMVIKLSKLPLSSKNVILGTICAVIGGLLNPSHLLFFLMFLGISYLFIFKQLKKFFPWIFIFFALSGIVLLYNNILFQSTMPWSRMYTLMRGFNPPVTFINYLFALGPVLILALLSIFTSIRKSTLGIFIMMWGLLPILLFHFLGRPLPMNASRLFQSYQYIPLAILATFGTIWLANVLKKIKIPPMLVYGLISIAFLLYSLTPFSKGMQTIIDPIKPWYINQYVPLSAIRTFEFLDTHTPQESVVLASEATSTMLPAFTHNRVLMGRDDVAPDYYEKRDKAFAMLDGRFSESDARNFLNQYKVKYILFGFDAQQFRNTSNPSLPFLKEIYSDETISVVEVLL